MLITDHNSYKAYRYYKKLQEKPDDFVVLKGIEYDTINAGHMLVIMPSGVNLPILELRGLPLLLLIEIVHFYGGIIGPAHPCGERFLSVCNTLHGKLSEYIYHKFDFVEGYNACEDADSNMRAMALSKKYDLPCFGGSDSHHPDCVGTAYTELKDEIASESELVTYIKEKGATKFGGEYYEGTVKGKLGILNHVLVESFWVYNRFASMYRHHKRKLALSLLNQ